MRLMVGSLASWTGSGRPPEVVGGYTAGLIATVTLSIDGTTLDPAADGRHRAGGCARAAPGRVVGKPGVDVRVACGRSGRRRGGDRARARGGGGAAGRAGAGVRRLLPGNARDRRRARPFRRHGGRAAGPVAELDGVP